MKYTNGSSIAFGAKVSYVCEEGYFFEENYNMPYFNLTCLSDGNFSSPLPWKRCLDPRSESSWQAVGTLALWLIGVFFLMEHIVVKMFKIKIYAEPKLMMAF